MCTGIKMRAQNGSIICGRTLEFAQNIESKIILLPRNYQYVSTSAVGKGLKWSGRYAVVGANAANQVGIIDGINEKGLAGGLFYFPEYAQYQTVTESEDEKSVAPWELLTWILSNFANVSQVRDTLPTIYVTNTLFAPWGIVPPLHAIIHDPSGQSIVIEYIKGNLIITDNPLGVFTNAPSFDWHQTNLKNYINLSPFNIAPLQMTGTKLAPLGQGSGMLGLPGDFTSPSRFIRAAAYIQSLIMLSNEEEARRAAFHILNLFDIPYGSVRQKDENKIEYEFTQWTSVTDLKNRRYYITTHDNRNVQMIDLMKLNLDAMEPLIFDIKNREILFDIATK